MTTDCRILFLEDREDLVEQVADHLKQDYLPCDLTWVKGRQALQNALRGGWSYELLLVGELAADFPGQEVLALIRGCCPFLPVILLSAGGDAGLAAESLRQGATDVVDRSALVLLVPALRRALKEARSLVALRAAKGESTRLAGLLRTVLETSTEGLLVVDLAGRVTAYNRKFMSLCGIPEYVMAPMELERVLEFLQDQFADPAAFLSEARIMGGQAERKRLGRIRGKDQGPVEVWGRTQRLGQETVGKVFSFQDAKGQEGAADPLPGVLGTPDLVDAARAGRMVPWYLHRDELVISDKGLAVLDLHTLPRDLLALQAIVHPADLDRLRRGLENPRTAPFELRMRRGCGSWVKTLWNMKRDDEGYRGIFTELAGGDAPAEDGGDTGRAGARFNYQVRVLQVS